MSLFYSENFASAAAAGTDWRDTSKNVLEKLENVRQERAGHFNLGFLYISDHLADDAVSIFNLFRSVLGIENWVGSVGMGVIGCGEAFVDKPAIAAMIASFPSQKFCVFPAQGDEAIQQESVKEWFKHNVPILTLVHGDPLAQQDPAELLRELEKSTGAFLVGGLTSSRSSHLQIANAICENSISGVFFDETIEVATTLSQGCEIFSPFHTITRADQNIIFELDGKRALTVFQDALRHMAAEKLGKKPEQFVAELKSVESSERVPQEFEALFQGQIHVALPVSQSDQRDFLVRNITGIDVNENAFSISDEVSVGQRLVFVTRNDRTVSADIERTLVALKDRVTQQRGVFAPKGGIYISCVARGFPAVPDSRKGEISILQEIIGNVPLAGFYAGGEINKARLYGYTGILILFF